MEKDVILMSLTELVKQLKKKSRLVELKQRLLEMSNEELMRKCGVQNTVVGKSVNMLVISFQTRFVGMARCISTIFSESCSKKMSELDFP